VPNCDFEDLKGWKQAIVGAVPPRVVKNVRLDPKFGHDGAFHVRMEWGDSVVLPEGTDGGTVERGEVAVTFLTRLAADDDADTAVAAAGLDQLFAG
jgi:hypothetical protein